MFDSNAVYEECFKWLPLCVLGSLPTVKCSSNSAILLLIGVLMFPHYGTAAHSGQRIRSTYKSKLNCERLYDKLAFEVRWAVAGSNILMQLISKLEYGEYMTFGISSGQDNSQVVDGDMTVAWVDKNFNKGYALDYYLDRGKCSGARGFCPDEKLVQGTDSIRLLTAAIVDGYSVVTYHRPLKAIDKLHLPIFTNTSQPVIWAIGPLNSMDEASPRKQGYKILEFGRRPVWNCPIPEDEEELPRPTARTDHPFYREHENREVVVNAAPATNGGKPPTPRKSKPNAKFYASTYHTPSPGVISRVELLDQPEQVSHRRSAEIYSPSSEQPLSPHFNDEKDGTQKNSQHEQQPTENEYQQQQLQNDYQQEIMDRLNQELLYQQQRYEQLRSAFEQELRDQKYRVQSRQEPYRYRLVPRSTNESQRK